jgi:L-serine dehydratase
MTYKGQKSDKGFTGGILGWNPDHPELYKSLEEALKQGIEIKFDIKEFKSNHPNIVRITLISIVGEKVNITAISSGGGMVEIIKINDFSVSIAGDYYELLIFANKIKKQQITYIIDILKNFKIDIQKNDLSIVKSKSMLNIKTSKKIPCFVFEKIKKIYGVNNIKKINPVLPVLSDVNCKVPFRTAQEMIDFSSKKKISLWEAAVFYESCRSGWSNQEVYDYMKRIIAVMKNSINIGLSKKIKYSGFLKPKSSEMEVNFSKGNLIPTGVLDKVTVYALSTMEVSNSMGVVVAAPTAGSCGVLPGSVLGTSEKMGLNEDDEVKAMLAAGIIGVFVAEQATFAAEVCGCQAECGVASAMAAAGVSNFLEGTIEQSVISAALALQNVLGLICDPVAGSVQIPCVNRNVMASANAITSANMVLAGFDPLIPLDEVIKTMFEVGKMLPRELRCTGLGGLCTTATAKKIEKECMKM